MNKKLNLIPDSEKTAQSLRFKRTVTTTLIFKKAYLVLKLKFVESRGYETCNTKDLKKEHKKEAKADVERVAPAAEEDEEAPVQLVTHVKKNILHSIFSNVVEYIKNQQTFKSNGLYPHKSYISNNFEGAISEYRGVWHCEGCVFEEFPDEVMESFLSEPFFTRINGSDGFMLYGELVLFSSTLLNCYIQL